MTKILVIDDELSMTRMVKDMLEEEGYTVLTATNPEVGLKLVSQENPDLIMCDRLMPVMTGNDVCRELYLNEELRSIPIVMMSAVNNLMARPMPNCRQFLAKPFHFLQLIDTVEAMLGQPA